MNTKKWLVCITIATLFLLKACVKKEEAKLEQSEKEVSTPVASVENQIPKNQQVELDSKANNATLPTENNETSVVGNPLEEEQVNLQVDNDRKEELVTPNITTPRKETHSESHPALPRHETQAKANHKEKPVSSTPKPVSVATETMDENEYTESSNDTTAQQVEVDTIKTKSTKPVASSSETPRAKPAPITEKANQAQSIDDAIKQAIDAATPAK